MVAANEGSLHRSPILTLRHDRSTLLFFPFSNDHSMEFFSPERIEKTKVLAHDGKPFIFDDGDIRTLHFNQHVVQSAMRLSAPDELVILYTQMMSRFLALHPVTEHILLIGLGGGSLVKYCYRQFPAVRMTVLESNADVIALRDRFMIPPDDARLQVLHVDAVQYLAQMAAASVDVILLDGFDADGAPQALRSRDFVSNCKRVLREQGVLVVNMGDDNTNIVGTVMQGRAVFGVSHLWWFRTIRNNSHIAVAINAADDAIADALLHSTTLRTGTHAELEFVYPKNMLAE